MRASESRNPHTRLLRVGLAEPESREYWRQSQRNLEEGDRVRIAFEERWFGSRAMARVQYLVQTFQVRFDSFPSALKALAIWNPTELSDRLAVCHWHLQLSDPIYRKFSSTHLVERFNHPQPTLDRNAVLRWAQIQQPTWSLSTVQRLVAGLMGCLNEVGFTQKVTAIRPLSLPRVSDLALGYAMYLLRETDYEGTLSNNPYLASLGLAGEALQERLPRVPGLTFRKMSGVTDLEWHQDSLWGWAQANAEDSKHD